jgi:peptidoglycan/xylan/chitin deacetylase (PgdA/CDA1 family)
LAVKVAVGYAAGLPGLKRRTRRVLEGGINVVYAHYVGPQRPHVEAFYYGTDAAWLDATLKELARSFTFAPLADVLAGTAPSAKGRAPLAVTFDDGFDMMSGGVLEVLGQHGVSATVFVITGCVGNQQLMWRNKLSAMVSMSSRAQDVYADLAAERNLAGGPLLGASRSWPMADKDVIADQLWRRCDMPPLQDYLARERPYFTWDGLRSWIAAGHSVGLHTRTHPRCDRLVPADVDREIAAPAAQLRVELGLDAVPLSYPFGLRLAPDTEEALVRDGVVSSAFGIRGFAPRGTPSQRLERAPLEKRMRWEVFGRSLARSFRRRRSWIVTQ